MPSRKQTDATTLTKEQIWAAGLDAEQAAARLAALADDLKALPIAQRQALLREAATRLFDGTPVWKPTTLPTAKQVQAATSQPTPAEPAPERAPRRRKTGDPRADRATPEGAA